MQSIDIMNMNQIFLNIWSNWSENFIKMSITQNQNLSAINTKRNLECKYKFIEFE